MILALVSSGRSLSEASIETNEETALSAPPATCSTLAEPAPRVALAKAVPRTVMTFLASVARTVAMALPA